jgi:hypothetical protein
VEITRSKCTKDDFRVGTPVVVVAECVDFYFFFRDTGVVTHIAQRDHLPISVWFDEPRCMYGGDYVQKEFNFDPEDLKIRKKVRVLDYSGR